MSNFIDLMIMRWDQGQVEGLKKSIKSKTMLEYVLISTTIPNKIDCNCPVKVKSPVKHDVVPLNPTQILLKRTSITNFDYAESTESEEIYVRNLRDVCRYKNLLDCEGCLYRLCYMLRTISSKRVVQIFVDGYMCNKQWNAGPYKSAPLKEKYMADQHDV